MIDRRGFLACGGSVAASLLLTPAPAATQQKNAPASSFRTIAYNVYLCQGWPKKRDNEQRLARVRPQMARRLALELALYEPDFVTLSEAPEEGAVIEIAREMGMAHAYFPSPEGFPGAVLTRHRIVESANAPSKGGAPHPPALFTRHFGRALLETPMGELAVYSAHLNPHSSEVRMREIAAILEVMDSDIESGRSVLVQGDFNHRPDKPEYALWKEGGLIDTAAAKGAGPNATSRAGKPGMRIDYIWAHGRIAQRLTECRVLFEGAFRLNLEDPKAFALSDHLPVMATFATD